MRLLLPFLLFFFFLQSWLLCTVLVLFPATKHPPYSPDAQHSALIEHGAPAGQDLPKAYIIACYTYSFHAFLANMRAKKHALILAGQDQFYPNTSRDSLQEKNAKIGGKTAFVPHRNQLGSGFPAVLPAIRNPNPTWARKLPIMLRLSRLRDEIGSDWLCFWTPRRPVLS